VLKLESFLSSSLIVGQNKLECLSRKVFRSQNCERGKGLTLGKY